MPKLTMLALVLLGALAILAVLVVLTMRGGGSRFRVSPSDTPPVPEDPNAIRSPMPSSTPSAAGDWRPSERVLEFVRAGETIQAIKAVREETGLGLKDAKDFVDALAASDPVALPPRGSPAAVANFRPDAATLALVREGRKLEAIVAVREASGMGLKEAKEFVEALARENR